MSVPVGSINTIKTALIAALEAKQADLGIKTIKSDISPNDIVEACKTELAYFPAVLVNYAGRVPTRLGTTLQTDPTFALFLADRNMSGPYVSGTLSIDLIEALVELIDNQRFSNAQKGPFEFAGDQLMYQDTTMVIYQLLFRTTTLHQRRF